MFAVQTPGGVRYTRAGHFEVAQDGRVVDGSGNALLDTQSPADPARRHRHQHQRHRRRHAVDR
jgi:flagellar basal body rod protein FlgG